MHDPGRGARANPSVNRHRRLAERALHAPVPTKKSSCGAPAPHAVASSVGRSERDDIHTAMVRLSSIKWGVGYTLMILGVVTYVLVVARTGTPTVPTALGVPYGYAPAVTRVLGPTIAMSVTILKL